MTMDNAIPPAGQEPAAPIAPAAPVAPATPVATPPPAQPVPEGDPSALQSELQRERARRSGLDTLMNTRLDAMEQQMTTMTTAFEQFVSGQAAPEGQTPSEPPDAGQPDPVAPQGTDENNFMQQIQETRDEMASALAQLNKDRLIREMTQPGSGLEHLNLYNFADVIPTHQGVEEQQQAITDFAQRLQGVMGTTQQNVEQAMLRGATPGSSPGQPPPVDAVAGAREIWERLNNPQTMEELSQVEWRALEAEWDQVPAHVQNQISSGVTQPWPDVSLMMDTFNRRLDTMQAQMQNSPGAQMVQNPRGPGGAV